MHSQFSISPPTQPPVNLSLIINSDPLIADYFNKYTLSTSELLMVLKSLILDGIRYRIANGVQTSHVNKTLKKKQIEIIQRQQSQTEKKHSNLTNYIKDKSGEKHYNVAYIKHNRFLSPKQKQQRVTPKITQIIPPKSPPHAIYGKPKVRVQDGWGCPFHEQYCQSQVQHEPVKIKQIHVEEFTNQQNQKKIEKVKKQWESYQRENEQKTLMYSSPISKKAQTPRSTEMERTFKSPSPIYIEDKEEREYSQDEYLSTKFIKSPKQKQRKKKTQSRIKELINRDKANKALQKRLKAQEKRMNEMEIKITNINKNRSNERLPSNLLTSKEDIFDISNSESSAEFETIDAELLNKLKNKQKGKNFKEGKLRVVVNNQKEESSSSQFD